MCAICHSSPCNSRCPNASEAIAIDDCYLCDEPIREGEEYFTIGGVAICSSCAGRITVATLSDITGLDTKEIIYELGGEEKVGESY